MELPDKPVEPSWHELVSSILREGTPRRVHHIEIFLDGEVQDAICRQFHLLDGLDSDRWEFPLQKQIRLMRFLGYDYVRCGLEGMDWSLRRSVTEDTASLPRAGGRSYVDEHAGPITSWEEFESYPWPDPHKASSNALEWYEQNLPQNMCVIGSGGFAHFAEHLTWLMGYETLCCALYDERDLVEAIAQKLYQNYNVVVERLLQFERVKVIWGSDDMGFRTGTLISPNDLREFVLPGHKLMAQKSHAAGRPYLLHSCGNLKAIMEDLIEDVQIDAKHSLEDTIESVIDFRLRYGHRIAALGGIDVDFLCRADEEQIRARVRETLEACMPGGGYVLGTGNSVANYIPLRNYLVMLDEGRRLAP